MTHQTSNTDLREQIAEGLLTARQGGDMPTLTDYLMQLIEADKAAEYRRGYDAGYDWGKSDATNKPVSPNDTTTPTDTVDELGNIIELIWRDEFTKEEATTALKALIARERLDELQRRRSRFEVPEQELSADGVHKRPAAEGRNKLKRLELASIDRRIAELQATTTQNEGEKS